jgi:hypothetical protein
MVDGIVASWVMFAVVLFWTGSAVSCAMNPIPVSELEEFQYLKTGGLMMMVLSELEEFQYLKTGGLMMMVLSERMLDHGNKRVLIL